MLWLIVVMFSNKRSHCHCHSNTTLIALLVAYVYHYYERNTNETWELLCISLFPYIPVIHLFIHRSTLQRSPHLTEGMQSRKHKPTPWSAVFKHPPPCLRIIYPCCVLLWLMETFVAGSIPHCWSDQGAGATQRNNTHCRIRDDRNALSHNLHFYKGTFQLPQAAPCGAITLKKTFPDKQPYFLCCTKRQKYNIFQMFPTKSLSKVRDR